MSLYKLGDRVVVRTDLVEDFAGEYRMLDDPDEWNTVTSEMNRFAGEVVTIRKCCRQYEIEEDGGRYSWTDEMFAGLESQLYDSGPIEIGDLESFF